MNLRILFIFCVCCGSGKSQNECADPVSSDPHLMLDTRTYDNIVVFTCDVGYRLSSPYYFAQCKNGVWDQITPSCEAIECPVNRELLLYPKATTFYYGDTVSFSCPMEYEMKGPSILTCGADSSWGQDLPECVAKECKLKRNGRDYTGHMNVTSSGRVCQRWASQFPHIHGYHKLADQANYCRNPNHNIVGPWCYTTDPELQWEVCDVPLCVCDLPTDYDSHLVVENKNYYYGDNAYFSCVIGYERMGTQSLRCQSDGSWLGTFPTCQAIVCPIPSNIDKNLLYQVRTYHYNDILQLSCVKGFTLSGSSSLTCLSKKRWSDSFPTCSAVQCGISGHHPKLRYQYKTYHFPDEVHFSCLVGFDMVGQGILVCTADGSWSMPYPTCNPVTCPSPGEEHHLLFIEKTYEYGDNISLTCQYGYTMDGPSSLMCRTDGRWDAELPTCQAMHCPTPVTTDEHLSLTDKTYRYTDELHVSCDPGYYVDGQTSVLCQANGTWSGELPACRLQMKCPTFTMSNDVTLTNTSSEATYQYGTKLGFTCTPDYVMIGPTSITCQEDGTWSSLPPQCVKSALRQADMESSGLMGGLIAAFVFITALVIIALLIAHKRKNRKKQHSVKHLVRKESSFKATYGEMDSEVSDDFDSFSDSFEYIAGPDTDVQPKDVSNPYYEFTPLSNVPEGTIAVDNLQEFVNKDLKTEGYVTTTFAKFKEGLQEPVAEANLPENKIKNRYKHVFPYDTTRVCLEKDAGDTSDYINASYINGFEKIHQYVAAQGPMKTTVNDFWKMVWHLGSTKIVMLTNLIESGKTKCQQYWPKRGSEQFSSITVTLESEEDLGTFVIRQLKVQKGTLNRCVTQFHYTDWPDQKAPPSAASLVQFYRKVESLGQQYDVPVIVHCRNSSCLYTRL
ncbi:sushi, von Willebrand factor type A, EGF and pentraxin domain-containing protein 1-like [Pecten maximus]|uniref:sushi, von Willebrand factor type A, EGF and pentraxin domain-containing protein 1-like n=1 Tax=Pecten maximus TaxID=6579 RepID=UPI00145830CE|nr:sushi, von Willebrand factor type A, EGF and pentraxin domain-containing protein 1-like [Pecten maximus]